VYVRSREEILATLDERGRLEELPFQPEMLAFCGRRFRVQAVAHKTCDTINKTGGRSMARAVHLEGTRCDGSAHAGCEADCLFFWKEAWLRRESDPPRPVAAPPRCSEETLLARTRAPGQENAADPAYVCQTTALFDATAPLEWWDVRQYVRDVTSGNHGAWHMFKLLFAASYRNLVGLGYGYRVLVWIYNAFQKLTGGKPFVVADGRLPKGSPTPTGILDLQPGEWVVVKPLEDIRKTITVDGFNRGMRYDVEMAKYSGGRYRVQKRVSRLLDEKSGKLLVMKSPCIQLEQVFCRAECTPKRIGCPRAMNTYWREIWLERDGGAAPASAPPAGTN
jgi:hypothetical protein